MHATFNDLVTKIRNLSLTEKLQIKAIVEKSIIEERRKEIYDSYIKTKLELKNNKLKFTSDVKKLKKMIE
jgi:Cdc6-like AAA superfamily ATPase